MTRLECSWFKADIGPRLKPVTKRVYEVWSGLTGDELDTHLHSIVSITHQPTVPDSKLTRYISATKHGHLPSTLASENGYFFSQASPIFPSTLVSLTAQKQAPRSSTWLRFRTNSSPAGSRWRLDARHVCNRYQGGALESRL